MQKFCCTQNKGLGIAILKVFLRASYPRSMATRPVRILFSQFNRYFVTFVSGIIFTTSFISSYSLLANDNANYYLKRINCNDEHTLEQTSIDSLYALSEQLDLPAVWELEIEIGHPVDSMITDFEYKLAGFENTWNYSSNNLVRYTNLPGQQYELRIRKAAGSGKSKRFVFYPAHPEENNIRNEWWFQPLLTFCLLLIPFTIAYFLALDRSRRNLRLEMVRNQIASDLHDDVGANLGAINNLTDLLRKRHEHQQTDARNKIIEKIKSYTGDTITNLQDTVWAINPLNDSIGELLSKMREFAFLMLGAKDIKIDYNDQYNTQYPIQLDMQQRHAMFMMFKEVINNVVKHAQAAEVSVAIQSDKSSLTIAIQDNGIGFDTTIMHRGNGLKNFQKRAKENFIDLEIESFPDVGTRTQMKIHSLS